MKTKKAIVIALLIACVVPLSAQSQFGYKAFKEKHGYFPEQNNEYILRDGVITHKFYVDGELQSTRTYRCRTDVEGQDVLEVFTGIHKSHKMFAILRGISYENSSSDISHDIKKAMEYCEEASAGYKKGGCRNRAEDLEDVYDRLDRIRKSSYRDEMIKDLSSLLRSYDHLDTTTPCGYVY